MKGLETAGDRPLHARGAQPFHPHEVPMDSPLQPPPPDAPTVFQHLLEDLHLEYEEARDFLARYRIPDIARVGEPGLTPEDISELVLAWESERLEDAEGR